MKYGDEKREKLEKLAEKLYSRKAPSIIDSGRSEFKSLNEELEEDESENKEVWGKIKKNNFDELVAKVLNVAQSKHSFVRKIFIFSILFFMVAAGVATFVFLGGVNTISSKNVDIKITGPISVGGGQEISLDIDVLNNNNTDLDSASLLVEYPEGTRLPSDLSKEISQERFALGNIKSGDSYTQNLKLVFFGEKENVKQLKISLEYRVANSSALFYKEKNYEVSISSAPVIITATYPKEVNSNQDISLNIEIASNSKDKINDFLVKVDYPFGFVFKNSSPVANFDNNIWHLSDFKPGEKKNILINGTIIGQDKEERVFKISAGTADEKDERLIAVPFTQSTESILVNKSFMGLDVLIGGKRGDVAWQGGKQATTEFSVTNNLTSKLYNVSVEVSLRGGALDRLSVLPANGGFFQSSNDTILWDKRLVDSLAEMDPGDSKDLSFRLTPLLYTKITRGASPEIGMIFKVKGERILESGSAEQVSISEDRKIVLASDISLNAKTVRSIGNIENSGPIPPKADTLTTYTILWAISNSFNQISNVEVRAALPPYIKWTGEKNPASEILSYDKNTNELIWKVGSILPGVGFSSAAKQIYFQLELLPSLSQIGDAPYILGEATFSGTDKITGQKVSAKAQAPTTNFSGDPTFKTGDDKVVQ